MVSSFFSRDLHCHIFLNWEEVLILSHTRTHSHLRRGSLNEYGKKNVLPTVSLSNLLSMRKICQIISWSQFPAWHKSPRDRFLLLIYIHRKACCECCTILYVAQSGNRMKGLPSPGAIKPTWPLLLLCLWMRILVSWASHSVSVFVHPIIKQFIGNEEPWCRNSHPFLKAGCVFAPFQCRLKKSKFVVIIMIIIGGDGFDSDDRAIDYFVGPHGSNSIRILMDCWRTTAMLRQSDGSIPDIWTCGGTYAENLTLAKEKLGNKNLRTRRRCLCWLLWLSIF